MPEMAHGQLSDPVISTTTRVSSAQPDAGYIEDREKVESDSQQHHVDIQQAEKAFNALEKQLTKHSESSGSTATRKEKDVEKGTEGDVDRFDLREYLSSSNDANQRAGIKHKVRCTHLCRHVHAERLILAPRCRMGGPSGGR